METKSGTDDQNGEETEMNNEIKWLRGIREMVRRQVECFEILDKMVKIRGGNATTTTMCNQSQLCKSSTIENIRAIISFGKEEQEDLNSGETDSSLEDKLCSSDPVCDQSAICLELDRLRLMRESLQVELESAEQISRAQGKRGHGQQADAGLNLFLQIMTLLLTDPKQPDGDIDRSLTEQSPPPSRVVQDNPLEMDEILTSIMTFLTGTDLLRCRLVNRQWNRVATSQSRPPTSKIHVVFVQDGGKLVHMRRYGNSLTLEDFGNFLTYLGSGQDRGQIKGHGQPSQFPFPSTSLKLPLNNFEGSEIQSFLTEFGALFKGLSLDFPFGLALKASFGPMIEKLLVQQCDHVESLSLYNTGSVRDSEDVEFFPEGGVDLTFFPALRALHLEDTGLSHNPKIVQGLLRSSPNLKLVTGFEIKFFDPSSPAIVDKVPAIRTLNFVPKPFLDLCLYTEFALCAPRLHTLHFSAAFLSGHFELSPEIGAALEKILNSSQETLKHFSFHPLQFLQGHLTLPKLGQVTSLRFEHEPAYPLFHELARFFPEPAQLAQVFPNVTTIEFVTVTSGRVHEYWSQYFDYYSDLQVNSVTSLSLHNESDPEWLEALTHLFPQVENLRVKMEIHNFPPSLSVICRRFKNLRRLTVTMDRVSDAVVAASAMDSALTGFDEELCGALRMSKRFEQEFDGKLQYPGDDEIYRDSPSIFDAKNLTHFTMEFGGNVMPTMGSPNFTSHIVSWIGGKYGLLVMRQQRGVKAIVRGVSPGIRCRLEKFLPFMDVVES